MIKQIIRKMEKCPILLSLALSLTSCVDTTVIDMKNVTWKLSMFDLTTTSEQMNRHYSEIYEVGDDSYFATLTVDEESYACTIYMVNSGFYITLHDATSGDDICFLGEDYFFGRGDYDNPKKHKGEEYDYTIEINLMDSGAYYEYCAINYIKFPETLTFYGYQN